MIVLGLSSLCLLGAFVLWAPRIFRFIDSHHWDNQCRKWELPPSAVFDSTMYSQIPNNPNCWRHYLPYTSFHVPSEQLIYLHARRSESGHERLVAVHLIYDQFRRIDIRTRVCGARDWYSPSEDLWIQDWGTLDPLIGIFLDPRSEIQIYSGQSDPADESHFTFECKFNGHTRTVDGWLRSDDTVSIELRKDLTPPPPSSAASSR
jgi:hypothetical protein